MPVDLYQWEAGGGLGEQCTDSLLYDGHFTNNYASPPLPEVLQAADDTTSEISLSRRACRVVPALPYAAIQESYMDSTV